MISLELNVKSLFGVSFKVNSQLTQEQFLLLLSCSPLSSMFYHRGLW